MGNTMWYWTGSPNAKRYVWGVFNAVTRAFEWTRMGMDDFGNAVPMKGLR